jgi:RHS repeat-associated protein
MAKANPIRWSTKYTDDETDLVMYPARPYSSSTGRWLSRDPVEEQGGRNLYAFARNQPISRIDPDGRADIETPTICSRCGQSVNPLTGACGCLPDQPPPPDDPEDWYDPIQAAACFCKNYSDMRKANTIGADRYFHCKAHCCAAKKGAKTTAAVLGLVREVCDMCKNNSDNLWKQFIDSAKDMAANEHGLKCPKDKSCEDWCSKYRPNGLDPKY